MVSEIKKKIEEMDRLLSQKIVHKINGISVNLDGNFKTARNIFTNKNHTLTIESNIPFNIDTIRLPQTKIFHTVIDSDLFELSIIQYFDKTIIAVKKSNLSSAIKLSLLENLYINGELHRKGDIYNLRINSISIFSSAKFSEDLDSVEYLDNIYKKEISLNPLKLLTSREGETLSNIDHLWGKLDLITADKTIRDIKHLFWLQEVFLHFNWIEELSQSYISLNKFSDNEYFKQCRQRFNNYLNEKNIDDFHLNNELINQYIYGDSDKEKLHVIIERHWAKIAYPIRDLYFAKSINSDPDPIIALLFLAIRENYFWYPMLLEKIKKYLQDEQLLTIILLLAELKKQSNLFLENDKFYYSPFLFASTKNAIVIPSLSARFSCYQNYGNFYTSFESKKSSIKFSIDKSCKISYWVTEKKISIEPLIFSPFEKINYKFMKIEINKTILNIPLLWRSFVINYNSTRFKFLLKKKRWQISIKIGKRVTYLSINDEKIDFSEKQYLTHFYENMIKDDFSTFKFFDEYGVAVNSLSGTVKKFSLRGVAIRGNGLLAESFNLFREKSHKSKIVNTNEFTAQYINNSFNNLNFKISTSKFNTVDFKLSNGNGIISGIKKLSANNLKYRLIILTENFYGEEEIEKISEIFYRELNFYPLIKPYKNCKLSNKFYHILFSMENSRKTIDENSTSDRKNISKVFRIRSNDIDKALLELFAYI